MGDQGDPQQVRRYEPIPNLYDFVSLDRTVRMAFFGRKHPMGGNRLLARPVPDPIQPGNLCSQVWLFCPVLLRGSRPGAGVVLTFDDGPDPSGTKRLLETLSHHGVKAAFFPIGMKAEAHPELLRELDKAGHVIGNHTYRHAWFTTCW